MIITSVGVDARGRAALRNTLQDRRFGELREGVWMRPANLGPHLPSDVAERVRVLTARDDDAGELASRLWDLPAWAATGLELLAEIERAAAVPDRFVVAAGIVRHLVTDPMLPDDLLPPRWPGDELRRAYQEFATDLVARRDGTQLMETT